MCIGFPQHKSCGPIEGVCGDIQRAQSILFPQHKSCGPIEG